MNIYPATAFLRHLLTARSTAGHGVHSPFVFDFLTRVVRGKGDPQIMGEVERLRREMLSDRRTVRVTDLGAGAAVHKGEERRISEIAATAALPARQAALLSRIADSLRVMTLRGDNSAANLHDAGRHIERLEVPRRGANYIGHSGKTIEDDDLRGVPPELITSVSEGAENGIASEGESVKEERRDPVVGEPRLSSGGRERDTRIRGDGGGCQEQGDLTNKPGTTSHGIILELGTSLGITTLALALAAPERRVVTVEGCPVLAEIARESIRNHGAANAEVLNMEFSDALGLLRREGTEVSLAFIDGNHRGEALKQYVRNIRAMGEEMIIVADDIHMNSDMYSAWCSLEAPASLETFRLGLLFCLRSMTPGRYRVWH